MSLALLVLLGRHLRRRVGRWIQKRRRRIALAKTTLGRSRPAPRFTFHAPVNVKALAPE